jgi:quinolinate synthetase A subunit
MNRRWSSRPSAGPADSTWTSGTANLCCAPSTPPSWPRRANRPSSTYPPGRTRPQTGNPRPQKERNAVILAHNYQTGDIQDVADYVGDSLGLAYHAKATDADVIAFCGVHFMAETAKIVNPGKIVVLPDADAGCSLEQSCPADQLEAFLNRTRDKNYYVIAYINCSGAVKALCDVICTSGNAVKIVNQAPPTGRSCLSPMKTSAHGSWNKPAARWTCGKAIVMSTSSSPAIRSNRIKAEYPDALVVAHPECTQAVRLLADEVCSTEKMVSYCRTRRSKTSSSSPRAACSTACARSARTRTSSPAPPTAAPARTAAT